MLRLISAFAAVVVAAGAAAADPLALIVEKAEASFDAATGQPVIALTLSGPSAAAFGEFTAGHIGDVVELRIDGEVVMAPIVREAIRLGQVQISGTLTEADTKEIAARIAAGKATIEVEAQLK